MKFLNSTTYYLCWDIVIAVHVPWVLFVGKLPLCLHGSIVDNRQRGVHWVLFVEKLPLCFVDTYQRGVHWVLFVRELPLSESCVRELPLCLHDAIVGCCRCRVLCSLGIARRQAVRKVLFVRELPLSENYVGELPLCLHRIIMDTRQRGVCWVLFVCREVTFVRELRQGVTFLFA
jgi:hypothetical protein